MSKELRCPVCGKCPQSYSGECFTMGTTVKCWVVECDDNTAFPYLEHRVTIYGSEKETAEFRWGNLFTTREVEDDQYI